MAAHRNTLRFLVTDLILGRVDTGHPLYRFLRLNGMSQRTLHWFLGHPAKIDLLALDYYIHSEMQWRTGKDRIERICPSPVPKGFATVARDYIERYQRPVMLGETNIRGEVADRLGWLKYTYQECEALAQSEGVDFRGYGWFPIWDSCAWARDLCRTAKTEVDPVGIYSLDEKRERRIPTELSRTFEALAKGRITSRDIRPYAFQPPVSDWMRGYARFTEDWVWREAGEEAA
ncbi:MAG: hypothetical protein JO323_22640 [Acidobacteriia bacterium]|nr:hypothetical protein [Terriglobia bacterium]